MGWRRMKRRKTCCVRRWLEQRFLLQRRRVCGFRVGAWSGGIVSTDVARHSAVYSACQLSLHVLMNMGMLSNSNILCSDLSVCRPGFALGISVFLNTHSGLLPDSCAAMAQRWCFERTKLLPLLPPLFFGSLASEVNSWAQTFLPDVCTVNYISSYTSIFKHL